MVRSHDNPFQFISNVHFIFDHFDADFWDPNESDDEHGALPVTLNGVSRRLPPPPKLNLGRPATSSVQ
jgi:hypothetical protein